MWPAGCMTPSARYSSGSKQAPVAGTRRALRYRRLGAISRCDCHSPVETGDDVGVAQRCRPGRRPGAGRDTDKLFRAEPAQTQGGAGAVAPTQRQRVVVCPGCICPMPDLCRAAGARKPRKGRGEPAVGGCPLGAALSRTDRRSHPPVARQPGLSQLQSSFSGCSMKSSAWFATSSRNRRWSVKRSSGCCFPGCTGVNWPSTKRVV